MVVVSMKQSSFERLAQLLAASDTRIPTSRYVRESTELTHMIFDTKRFSGDVQRVFGILITQDELSAMKTVGDIVQRMASTVTVPEQVLSQQVASRLLSSLAGALSIDASLQHYEVVLRVARQQGAYDPIRFRWAPMHHLPEIKIEYRPADLIDWGEDSHFDMTESHANIDGFAHFYNL